jgi:hypothetical protein
VIFLFLFKNPIMECLVWLDWTACNMVLYLVLLLKCSWAINDAILWVMTMLYAPSFVTIVHSKN